MPGTGLKIVKRTLIKSEHRIAFSCLNVLRRSFLLFFMVKGSLYPQELLLSPGLSVSN